MWRGDAQGDAAFWQIPASSSSLNTCLAIVSFSGFSLLNLDRSGVELVCIRWIAECVLEISFLFVRSDEKTSLNSLRTDWIAG